MYFSQSNTRQGPITVTTATDLTGTEGSVCTLAGGVATLGAAATDLAIFVVVNVINKTTAEIMPIESNKEFRAIAQTTITAGAQLVAASYTNASSVVCGGLAPGSSSGNFIVAIAEEAAVAGQLVLCRALLTYHS